MVIENLRSQQRQRRDLYDQRKKDDARRACRDRSILHRTNKDYGLTVETYKVSYNQIYSWVRKYEEGGVDKLKDSRGRTKPLEEMTEVEKLKVEMKILEAKKKLRAIISIIKAQSRW